MSYSKPLAILALILTWAAHAEHLGVIGTVYPIQERDALELIMNSLREKQRSGEILRWQEEGRKRAIETFLNPPPVQGVVRTQKPHSHYWDPTVRVERDIIDPVSGRVIVPAGTTSNPLDYISLSKHLLFLDGTDAEQRAFAQRLIKRYRDGLKIILVKGSPKKLSEQWRHGVYFGQGGALVRRLAIKQVPALVYQEGRRIRIDELLP